MHARITRHFSDQAAGNVELIKPLIDRVEKLETAMGVANSTFNEIKPDHHAVIFCLHASIKQASVAANKAFEATRLARTMARKSMLAAAKASQHGAYDAVTSAVISTSSSSQCAAASASATACAAAAVANALLHQMDEGTIALVIESLELAQLASGMALDSSLLANAARELNRNPGTTQ